MFQLQLLVRQRTEMRVRRGLSIARDFNKSDATHPFPPFFPFQRQIG